MKHMSGLDRIILNIESDRVPMDFIGIFTLNPLTAAGHDFERTRTALASRLPSIPVFARRPISAPFVAGHDHWIVDSEFVLDRHFKHVSAPAPHDLQALCDLAVDLFDTPLDRSRPLWEMYYVDGLKLEDSSAALLLRMHHASLDAVGGIQAVSELFDSEPVPSAPLPPAVAAVDAERVPSQAEMLLRSIPEQLMTPARIVQRGMPVLLPLAGRLLRRIPEMVSPPPRRSEHEQPAEGPTKSATKETTVERTVFNRRPNSQKRSLAITSIVMDDVVRAKDKFAVTINDVVLSVVGGAVADYLRDRDELPQVPLRVAAPVNVRDETAEAGSGNHFTFMMVPIPSDLSDPVERLETIATLTRRSRPAVRTASGGSSRSKPAGSGRHVMALIDALPSSMWLAVGQLVKSPAMDALPTLANYVVSNIPGPRHTMFLAGAEITHLYGRTVTGVGIGLFIHCFSYAGNLDFGVTALADLVPDPEVIAEGIQRHFTVLLDAVDKDATTNTVQRPHDND